MSQFDSGVDHRLYYVRRQWAVVFNNKGKNRMAGSINVGGEKIISISFRQGAAEIGTDSCIFIAPVPCQILAANYVHSVAGNDAGAVNLQLTKDTGTDAPGPGTDLLADNSNAGWNCKGTANTVQAGTFKTTAGILDLNRGDRISLDYAGTTTNLAGVVVTLAILLDLQ